MSELCCKFQFLALSTVGVAETKRVLQSVTDARADKGKTIYPHHFVTGHENRLGPGLNPVLEGNRPIFYHVAKKPLAPQGSISVSYTY